MSQLEGRWIDTWVMVETGVPQDIGWGIVVLNSDKTVTRTCKGCGASVTSQLIGFSEVQPKAFQHEEGCSMWPFISTVQRG